MAQTETITILKVDTGEAVTSLNDLRNNIRLLKEQLSSLEIGSEDYRATLTQLTTNQNALRQAMNSTGTGVAELNTAISSTGKSYASLQAQMAALRKEWRLVDQSTEAGQARFAQLSQQINALNDELKAMDASTGSFQRNVGNYSSAFNGLNVATAQIVRELPSAAVSLNTFFLAISNNIPMLVDQIGLLREQNAKLIATGEKGISIFSAVAKSFLSWNTVLTLVITAVTLFGDKMVKFVGDMFKGKEAVDSAAVAAQKYSEAMDEVNKSQAEATAEASAYYSIATDVNRSMEDRLAAASKLKQEYPDYLQDMSEEAIAAGNAQQAYDSLTASLVRQAQSRAALNKITELQTEILEKQAEMEEKIAKAQEEQAKADRARATAAAAPTYVGTAGNTSTQNMEQFADTFERSARKAQREADDLQKEIDGIREAIGKLTQSVYPVEMLGTGMRDAAKDADLLLQNLYDIETTINDIDLGDIAVTNIGDIGDSEESEQERIRRLYEIREQGITDAAEQQKRWARINASDRSEAAEQVYRIEQDANQRRLALLQEYEQQALEAGDLDGYLEAQQQAADLSVQIAQDEADRLKAIEEEKTRDKEREVKNRTRIATSGLNAVGSIFDSLADIYEENSENNQRAAEQAKNLQIAGATINTIAGAIAAFMSAQSSIPAPWGIIVGAVQAAAVTAAGIAQIIQIRNTKIDRNSSSSSSPSTVTANASVSAPTVPTDVTQVRNITGASEEDRLNRMAQDQKVYILQSDIEAAGNRRKVQVAESSF